MDQVSNNSNKISAISACERGDLSKLQRVLDWSPWDVGSEPLDSTGQTVLHSACVNGHLHIVRYLVNERRCSILVEDVNGRTPLILSLINKHWKVANFLLKTDPSSASFHDKQIERIHSMSDSLVVQIANEAVVTSCKDGYFHLVMFLTRRYNVISETYVQTAFQNGHWEVAKAYLELILERGAHKSIGLSFHGLDQLIRVTSFKTYSLHIACSRGYLEVVKYLHEKDLCNPTEVEGKPVEIAYAIGQWRIVHFLLKYYEYEKPDKMCELHAACIMGDEMKVKAALSNSQSTIFSKTDQHGITAMHYAAYKEPKILTIIINAIKNDNRVPFNSLDKRGNTPLHFAVVGGCTESVGLLFQAPVVNTNLVNCKGDTPLHVACRHNDTNDILKIFVEDERCDFNIVNNRGNTVLHIALEKKASALEILTLHKSCNPSIADHNGRTPLQIATETNQLSAAEVLLHCAKCSREDISKSIQDSPYLLHRTIHADRDRLFSMLIEIKECDINRVNNDQQTPLHIACTVSNVEYVEILTQQPTCDLNIQDINGDTALHMAACSSLHSSEKIESILKAWERCDPNIINKQGHSPLHIAAKNRRFRSVERFLNCSNCNPTIQDFNGNSALHLSIDQMSITEIESFLFCDNFNINIQNRQGDTPLHIAVKQGASICVIETLAHHVRCNVSIANNEGMTPLQVSVNKERLKVANIMVQKCNPDDIKKIANEDTYNVLYKAVLENYLDLVQALLPFQSDKVNLRYNYLGPVETLLHAACRNGHPYMTDILLKEGADIQATDRYGDVPFHKACAKGNTEVIELLLKNNANILQLNISGDAPIHIACKETEFRCLKLLLRSKNCDINQQNRDGDTALHIVCRMGSISSMHFVQALISTPGIDPEIANHAGSTPIEVAGSKYLIIETINNFLRQRHSSIQAYLKVFVVGNSGTGKSTLIKAVTTEASHLLK